MQNYRLEHINCPLCDSSNYSIYIENAKELYNDIDAYFNVCKCQECGHCFTNPRLTVEIIKFFYPDDAGYYQPSVYNEPQGKSYDIYKKILNEIYGYPLKSTTNSFFARLAYFIKQRQLETSHIPCFRHNGRLLDVGCSYGSYLKKMQTLGWAHLYGTEINTK